MILYRIMKITANKSNINNTLQMFR